jgi:hypothetical protein
LGIDPILVLFDKQRKLFSHQPSHQLYFWAVSLYSGTRLFAPGSRSSVLYIISYEARNFFCHRCWGRLVVLDVLRISYPKYLSFHDALVELCVMLLHCRGLYLFAGNSSQGFAMQQQSPSIALHHALNKILKKHSVPFLSLFIAHRALFRELVLSRWHDWHPHHPRCCCSPQLQSFNDRGDTCEI